LGVIKEGLQRGAEFGRTMEEEIVCLEDDIAVEGGMQPGAVPSCMVLIIGGGGVQGGGRAACMHAGKRFPAARRVSPPARTLTHRCMPGDDAFSRSVVMKCRGAHAAAQETGGQQEGVPAV
jgi:hypothetical protein